MPATSDIPAGPRVQTTRSSRVARVRGSLAVGAAFALALTPALAVSPASAMQEVPAASADGGDRGRHGGAVFDRLATYPVYLNAPAGVDPAAETVSEISDVTRDGKTVIYTDAAGKRIGFVDISDPGKPVGKGTLDLRTLGSAEDEPTSVIVHGDYVLVVVNTSESYTEPSGRLDVVRISDRTRVRSIDLGGQPDSIAISPDGAYAAVAIENERDEDATPAGGKKGDLPQMPAGFVQVLKVSGAPDSWSATKVALTTDDGSALPLLAKAGIDTPTDPEPEYVSINSRNQLVVTLQENNGLVFIDLPSATVTRAFSAGSPTIHGVDVEDDGLFDASASITVPREPDAVGWIDDRYVATANEGDWKGGSRGWSIFDSRTGKVVWDAGNSFENLAKTYGLHNEARADNKGTEPEGLAVATVNGRRLVFVGSERSNFVAVYDVSRPARPKFVQVMPTTNGPEGLLPIPSRGLFVVSSEVDDVEAGVRATIGVYGLGKSAAFPTLVSEKNIGWGALSGLTAEPGRGKLTAVSDSAFATGRLYSIDARRTPARITSVTTVTENGKPVSGLDLEGISRRADGGYWLGSEGETGAGNQLIRIDRKGDVQQRVGLPADIATHVGKWGIEGVAVVGRGKAEQVYVALQRPLWTDPAKATGPRDGENVVRIGRFTPATGGWEWFGYRLESTSVAGDWLGLSEIALVRSGKNGDTLAVIERDKLNGPAAAVKRVYTVTAPKKPGSSLQVLDKTLAADLLPALRAGNGWTQEKVESLAIDSKGQAWFVTDNDGLKDNTGETVFGRVDLARRGR